VADDGRGFDPDQAPNGGLGLASLRERAESIGAALHMTSRPGEGTVISLSWPGAAYRSSGLSSRKTPAAAA